MAYKPLTNWDALPSTNYAQHVSMALGKGLCAVVASFRLGLLGCRATCSGCGFLR